MPAPVTKTSVYYEVLGLQPDATDDDVRVAYKKLVSWHIRGFNITTPVLKQCDRR
jgi:preprotein translocase subunit Sec63